LTTQLEQVPDSRRAASADYPLSEVLFISLCAMLSGADAFTEFEEFGQTRRSWFEKHLDLNHGIPSHDTFRNVFSLIDPKQFNHFFIQWTQGLCRHDGGELIAIDGKSLRGSSKDQAVHLVNAWSSANNLILGQMKIDKKSNEITAIPKLLEQLAIKGAVVTIDAMGTQKEIAKVIDEAGAHYVLSLKDNHPTLREDVALSWMIPKKPRKWLSTKRPMGVMDAWRFAATGSAAKQVGWPRTGSGRDCAR